MKPGTCLAVTLFLLVGVSLLIGADRACAQFSQDSSWVEWQDLTADDAVITCPAGDDGSGVPPATTSILVTLRDSLGAPVEGIDVRLRFYIDEPCSTSLDSISFFEDVVTDSNGIATHRLTIPLVVPTTEC